MTGVFLKLLNMSAAASWVILLILVLRQAFRKTPRWLNAALWGLAAFRLAVPFTFQSAASLLPSAQTFPDKLLTGPSFKIQTGIPILNSGINDALGDRYFEGVTVPVGFGRSVMGVMSWIWLTGLILMLLYAAFSYIRLARRVRTAVPDGDFYRSEFVATPFLLGILRPRILVPFGVEEPALGYILAHERAHLARRDHWWKPLGYLLLAVHWFNPLAWVAYLCFCRDIELACDERAVRGFDRDERASYSEALLDASTAGRRVSACPLAFGEGDVKHRVRSVLNPRKAPFWVVLLALAIVVAAAVAFLTDPREPSGTTGKEASESSEAAGSSEEGVEKKLTLDEVRRLGAKGHELSEKDLEPYSFRDIGSGLVIKLYEIDPKFGLVVGHRGGDPKTSPAYFALWANDGSEESFDIREPGLDQFIQAHRNTPTVEPYVNIALSKAILDSAGSGRHEENEHFFESHRVLAREDQGDISTFYMLVLCEGYEKDEANGELKQDSGFYGPVAIRLSDIESGRCVVEEYWTPRDGSYYEKDIREKFPKAAAEQVFKDDVMREALSRSVKEKAERWFE